MKELIEKYVQQGFKVFPCNADKTPATPQGFKNAHSDFNILLKQFYKDDMLIGLPTGNVNGIVVVDIDLKDGRSLEEVFEDLKEYGEFPDTLRVQTMSGGIHLYYTIEETEISSHTHFFHKNLPVDIRGNGGYVITADYRKYFPLDIDDIDEMKSHMAPLPEWIEKYRKSIIETPVMEGLMLPESEVREIRSALAYLDADDRDTWVRVGMCLKSTGTVQAKGLWTEWSMKSSKFNPTDQEAKWKTFKPSEITIASLFSLAKSYGWVTTYSSSANVITTEEYSQISEKIYQRPKFPEELLTPPGLVGEIAQYMNSQAHREQPIISVAAAIAFCGAIMGRRVQGQDGMRTNIYCMSIGETGCGKENARKCIKKIIYACNDAKLEGLCDVENIASETSIYTALDGCLSPLFMIDEIGIFLKSTQNSQAHHLAGIPAALLKMFTSSDVVVSGKSYADSKKKIRLNHPNLCIYGTATPEQFYNSLSKENIEQGLISRLLIFESECSRPPARRGIKTAFPDQELVEKIKAITARPENYCPHGNVSEKTIVNPIVIPMTHEAEEMMWDFNEEIDAIIEDLQKRGKIFSLHTRCVEIAKKISLIIAVGDMPFEQQPIIHPHHISYATKLTRYLFDNLSYAAENFISDNRQEKEAKKILQLIREKGKISMPKLTRKCQHLKSQERKDIISSLMEAELIAEMWEVDGKGKQVKKLVAL